MRYSLSLWLPLWLPIGGTCKTLFGQTPIRNPVVWHLPDQNSKPAGAVEFIK
jgi:hypothetical protein